MKVNKFEEAVWQKDGVRVVVRTPEGANVLDYKNTNAAADTLSVTKYLKNRILPRVEPFTATVVLGDGTIPHGRTLLRGVRKTYEKK